MTGITMGAGAHRSRPMATRTATFAMELLNIDHAPLERIGPPRVLWLVLYAGWLAIGVFFRPPFMGWAAGWLIVVAVVLGTTSVMLRSSSGNRARVLGSGGPEAEARGSGAGLDGARVGMYAVMLTALRRALASRRSAVLGVVAVTCLALVLLSTTDASLKPLFVPGIAMWALSLLVWMGDTAWAGVGTWYRIRRFVRDRKCPACGYDVSACPVEASVVLCPECGRGLPVSP